MARAGGTIGIPSILYNLKYRTNEQNLPTFDQVRKINPSNQLNVATKLSETAGTK